MARSGGKRVAARKTRSVPAGGRAIRSADEVAPATRPGHSAEFDAHVESSRQHVEHLVSVRVAMRGVKHQEGQLAAAVATARAAGSSWREIGLAVGMTAAGARKRWVSSTD